MDRSRPANPVELEDQRATALTKAALDAAKYLGLSPEDTAKVLGVAPAVAAAMRKGQRAVDSTNGEAERADGLVRVVKRLRKLLGEAESVARAWIRREHSPLGAKPLEVLLQRDGVLKVAQKLENTSSLTE